MRHRDSEDHRLPVAAFFDDRVGDLGQVRILRENAFDVPCRQFAGDLANTREVRLGLDEKRPYRTKPAIADSSQHVVLVPDGVEDLA
jgi:hypothetical protein